MTMTKALYAGMVAAGIAALVAAGQSRLGAQQQSDPTIRIGSTDLGGVVTGANGPEAGVWVIAETTELSTRFAKIVVTDDLGRYVMPDLPKATYSVWVRGYGLVDSPKVQTAPGKIVNLRAAVASSPAAAAEYYPAIYWYSMLKVPDKSEFPGTGPSLVNGNFVSLRVPYPMGFYTKWMDGRIDDPNAGWKGRGLWATYSTRAPFHVEGGKGTTSKVVKFRLRPDPLAR